MSYSNVDVRPDFPGAGYVTATARGGTRRQRAAGISAVLRRDYPGAERITVSYSETYGFQTATFARYRVAGQEA